MPYSSSGSARTPSPSTTAAVAAQDAAAYIRMYGARHARPALTIGLGKKMMRTVHGPSCPNRSSTTRSSAWSFRSKCSGGAPSRQVFSRLIHCYLESSWVPFGFQDAPSRVPKAPPAPPPPSHLAITSGGPSACTSSHWPPASSRQQHASGAARPPPCSLASPAEDPMGRTRGGQDIYLSIHPELAGSRRRGLQAPCG